MKRSLARLLLGIPILMMVAGILLILDARGITFVGHTIGGYLGHTAMNYVLFVLFPPPAIEAVSLAIINSSPVPLLAAGLLLVTWALCPPLVILGAIVLLLKAWKAWRYYFNGENA